MEIRQKTDLTVELTAAPGLTLRRKGDARSAGGNLRTATVAVADADNWEESAPEVGLPYTHEDYRREVQRLVALRYDPTREAGILREALAAMRAGGDSADPTASEAEALATFEDYNAYVESCKAQAIANLTADAAEAEEKNEEL